MQQPRRRNHATYFDCLTGSIFNFLHTLTELKLLFELKGRSTSFFDNQEQLVFCSTEEYEILVIFILGKYQKSSERRLAFIRTASLNSNCFANQ